MSPPSIPRQARTGNGKRGQFDDMPALQKAKAYRMAVDTLYAGYAGTLGDPEVDRLRAYIHDQVTATLLAYARTYERP